MLETVVTVGLWVEVVSPALLPLLLMLADCPAASVSYERACDRPVRGEAPARPWQERKTKPRGYRNSEGTAMPLLVGESSAHRAPAEGKYGMRRQS